MLGAIYFSKYGPFRNNENSIELAPYITLLIGRNNCGKSCLVDLICDFYKSKMARSDKGWPEEFSVDVVLTEKNIQPLIKTGIFLKNASESPQSIGSLHIGETLRIGVHRYKTGSDFYAAELIGDYSPENKVAWDNISNLVGLRLTEEMNATKVRRLAAERDIVSEKSSSFSANLMANGSGATALVQDVINRSNRDENLIEVDLLQALNEILSPDTTFESIRTQLVTDGDTEKWEIFLQEQGGKRLPLSSLGSGLKTVVLVLLQLLVDNPQKGNALFLFEELENSIHPSLQRRLFDYLYDYAVSNEIQIVLTSHSQTAINALIEKPGCALYHIARGQDRSATIHKVVSTEEGCKTLQDLGIKASDLFQANGIIWVEGPSDRIYIKAWLEALYKNEFIESLHYQFQYYGGRLLSHYSAEQTINKINIMFTNRNAAIVIDSDKREGQKEVNATKKRIREEFNSRNLFYWITKGKEIENYISVETLRKAYPQKKLTTQVEAFESFSDYIEDVEPHFASAKVDFAHKIAPYIEAADIGVLDLPKKIQELARAIRSWNS